MDINNITIALRPRSDWESFDLGFIMTRRWWGKLLFAWLLTAAPVYLVCAIAFRDQSWWTLFMFWWLKPLYEQLPLFFISRAVFNHIPDRQEIIRALPAWVLKRFFPMISWRRLSLSRSFTSPVTQLEGLGGRNRSERIRVLSGRRGAGFWLTLSCFLLEWAITLALIVLAIMMIPSEYVDPVMTRLENGPVEGFTGLSLFYFCGAAIMAPFYVVSGFALYLNRRTRLEGWDLELAFEKLATRIRAGRAGRAAAMAALLLVASLQGMTPGTAQAATADTPASTASAPAANDQALGLRLGSEQGKALITKVLDGKEFNLKETVTRWRLKEQYRKDPDAPEDLSWWETFFRELMALFSGAWDYFAGLGYYTLWLLAAFAIIAAVWLLPRLRPYLVGAGLLSTGVSRPMPETVFGLAVSRDSLPQDIAGEALRLVGEGHYRQALSLLYRGSLHRLISEHGLELRDSDTEGQCARRVRDGNMPVADYFAELTGTWVRMAYGHHTPQGPQLESLCRHWNDNFHRGQHGD